MIKTIKNIALALILGLVHPIAFSLESDTFEPLISDMDSEAKSILNDAVGEYIDLRTGKLWLEVNDIHIPMNGNLDITVGRSFNKHPLPQYSVAKSIGNWDIEIPRISGNWERGDEMCQDPRDVGISMWTPAPYTIYRTVYDTNFNPPLERIEYQTVWPIPFVFGRSWVGVNLAIPGQQTRELLFKYSNGHSYSPDNGKWQTEYVTSDGWKGTCIDVGGKTRKGFLITSPNGTKYTFDIGYSPIAGIAETVVHTFWPPPGWQPTNTVAGMKNINSYHAKHFYVSKIEDKNGNVQNYSYITDSRRIKHIQYIRQTEVHPQEGAKTQEVQFHYTDSDGYLLQKITYNNRAWLYFYTPGKKLSKVQGPNGLIWEYGYTGNVNFRPISREVVTRVINPTGGIFDYTYQDRELQYFGGSDSIQKLKVLRSKSTSDGGAWTYTLSQGAGTNITTIDAPNSTQKYTFDRNNHWRLGAMLNYTVEAFGSNFSELSSDNLYNDYLNSPSLGGAKKVVKKATFEWQQLAKVGDNFVYKRPVSITVPRVLAKQTIEQNGGTYITEYLEYDAYRNPHRIVETGDRIRETVLTYHIDTGKWITNLVKDEKITGVGDLLRNYDENGNLTDITRFGIKNEYTHHPNGEVATKTDANTKLTEYKSYYRGEPTLIITPELLQLKQSIDDSGNIIRKWDGRRIMRAYYYDDINRITGEYVMINNILEPIANYYVPEFQYEYTY